jgi:hypothetical protein
MSDKKSASFTYGIDELEDRVRAVVRGLVSDEELSAFGLSNVPPRPWPMGNEHSLWLILDVRGDGFVFPLIPQPQGETLDGLEHRIRTILERWVTESRSARAWAAQLTF